MLLYPLRYRPSFESDAKVEHHNRSTKLFSNFLSQLFEKGKVVTELSSATNTLINISAPTFGHAHQTLFRNNYLQ
jgi:hypothetical protein